VRAQLRVLFTPSVVCSVIIFFALIEVRFLRQPNELLELKENFCQLSISAWLTSRFTARHDYSFLGERDRTRFVLFASVWTLFFAALYMTVFQFSSRDRAFTSVLSYGILYVYRTMLSNMTLTERHRDRSFLLTWIIWTAAASSVTVMLGGGLNCGWDYTKQIPACCA
jgi:hypothetical protein